MKNCVIKAPAKATSDYFFFDFKIDDEYIFEQLGDFTCLKLMSGDLVFVQENYKDYSLRPNSTAAVLCDQPIYGNCILCEEKDYVRSRVRP